jgi:hypothetical protein
MSVGTGVGMSVGTGVGCGVGSEVGICKEKGKKRIRPNHMQND